MLALITGLGLITLAILFALIPIPIMFWALINCVRNPQISGGKKVLWVLAILFIYPIAFCAYPFVYDNESKLRKVVKVVNFSWVGLILILMGAYMLNPSKKATSDQAISPPCCLPKSEATAATENPTPQSAVKKYSANELYQQCTQKEAVACTTLGEAYKKGDGVKMNPKNATYYFTQACSLGDGRGCGLQGENMLPPWGEASYKEVGDIFLKGCQGQDDNSCKNLVTMVTGGTIGLTSYKEDVDSSSLQPETWIAQVQDILRLKCEANIGSACGSLGRILAKGIGGKPEPAKALGFFEKACGMEIWDSCSNASMLYISGADGIKKDMSKGMALASKSLDGSMKAFKAAQEKSEKNKATKE